MEESDFQSFRRKIPDFVLAAFFLSLVAFLSFCSQQKERNEQNTASYTKIFRFAQYDITTKTLRCAQHDKAISLFSLKEDYTRELHR